MTDQEPAIVTCLKCGEHAGHSNASCPNQTSEQRIESVIKLTTLSPRELAPKFESLIKDEILTREEAIEFTKRTLNAFIDKLIESIEKEGLLVDSGISSYPVPEAGIKILKNQLENFIFTATHVGILNELQPKIEELKKLIIKNSPIAAKYF